MDTWEAADSVEGEGVQWIRWDIAFTKEGEHLFLSSHGGQSIWRSPKGCEAQHRTGDALDSPMVLFQHTIEVFHLTDGNRGTMLPIVTPNRSRIRLTPIDRDLFDDAVPADYLLTLAFYPSISHTQRRHGYCRQRWKATGISSICWPLLLV
jgi:hypothetical protein